MQTRRAFLSGLLAAPAIVRAGSMDFVPRGPVLMPVRHIIYDSRPEVVVVARGVCRIPSAAGKLEPIRWICHA